MVTSILLVIIYLAFISLGLPDSLFGAAWPIMRVDLGVDTALAGAVSMICAGGTIVSSLSADRLIRRFGVPRILVVSVFLTAAAVLGYSFSNAIWMLCLLAVPLGLGGGAVDSALNNYVAVHYSARHMSWLHSMWGVGTTISPIILSGFLSEGFWQGGYRAVAAMQGVLFVIMLVSQPLWARVKSPLAQSSDGTGEPSEHIGNMKALRLPGVKWALLLFFCYCSAESLAGLWGATFLTDFKGATEEAAARGVSLYYAGITVGRILTGFVATRFSSKALIRVGQLTAAVGAVAAILLPGDAAALGLGVVGLGFAPIYPCTIHETPHRFGAAASQAVTGLQMAFAYTGTTFIPPLFGVLAGFVGIGALPIALALFCAGMFLSAERINSFMRRREAGR